MVEIVVKAWRVTALNRDGKRLQVSRHYHAKGAADEFAKVGNGGAMPGWKDFVVEEVSGLERKV